MFNSCTLVCDGPQAPPVRNVLLTCMVKFSQTDNAHFIHRHGKKISLYKLHLNA